MKTNLMKIMNLKVYRFAYKMYNSLLVWISFELMKFIQFPHPKMSSKTDSSRTNIFDAFQNLLKNHRFP